MWMTSWPRYDSVQSSVSISYAHVLTVLLLYFSLPCHKIQTLGSVGVLLCVFLLLIVPCLFHQSSRNGRSLRDIEGIDGGRGGPFAYMTPQAGMLFQMGLGNRWPGSAVPSGLSYSRRDLGGSMRNSWNPRGIPQAFLPAAQPAATLR